MKMSEHSYCLSSMRARGLQHRTSSKLALPGWFLRVVISALLISSSALGQAGTAPAPPQGSGNNAAQSSGTTVQSNPEQSSDKPAAAVPFSPAALPQSTPAGTIVGVVKSGNMALPGVTVTATNTLTGQKTVAWTDVNGSYSLAVPADGRYVVRAQMAAFAAATGEALIKGDTRSSRIDLQMILQSRATQQGTQDQQRVASAMSRGFQSLSVLQGEGGDQSGNGADQVVPSGMPIPGISSTIATESVAVSANNSIPDFSSMSSDEMRQRMQEFREQQGGQPGAPGASGGPGGPGGAGGFGGGGFGRGGPFMMGGRFDINRPHGSLYYSIGDSALNATPYSLTGRPSTKPSYLQNRYGVVLGGPLNIPKIYNGGTKTFFFLNYNGTHNDNPYDAFSTVPTLAERAGNFSQTTIRPRTSSGSSAPIPVQIFDPATGTPFPNNTITQIDPAAAALLRFIPLPNLPGVAQNFHFIESVANRSNDLNIRVTQALGGSSAVPGGGRGRNRGPQNNLTFGFHYHDADNVLTNPFPTLGGRTSIRSFDVPIGYIRSFGKLTNIFRVDYNRNRISTNNLYAFTQDVAAQAGINGVSQNPFDFGAPNLFFTNFGSLQDTNPLLRRDQTITFSDFLVWNHGKHTWRWGGDFRRIQLNTETSNNARGTFIFTGVNTSGGNPAGPQGGFGLDFADFLLGLPQLTSVQFGQNNYHFRGNSWDLFAQDEWKVRGNLTLNLGLRYEYVSPYSEVDNRLANLTLPPGLSAPPTPVVANANSTTLVNPDRNNFAPRIGLAWKPLSKTVVRAGYGINYNTTAYSGIVQQLAFQPPFSTTQTNVESATLPLTLQNGFPSLSSNLITNSYAVDPDYRLGYVQIWNLDVQQEIRPSVVLNLDYTGTKGTRLDIQEAPNRTATGILFPNVQPFIFETSLGDSIAHAGSVRLRKRLTHGVSIGGTYTYSKSIDDASNIGGGATIVAQDAFNLSAERGLSIFDQRHKFSADYLIELPFGHDRMFLNQKGILRSIFGDWQWSGDWSIASGFPFTPRVLGSVTDVNRGTNGTLRADVTGLPVSVPDPSVRQFFNTAAFVAPPVGQFGNARRNSIIGPGTRIFNMAFTKVFPLKDTRVLEFRAQASNIFNTPQFQALDTIVNSPTFGRITSAGAMRTFQLSVRFRF
jgi:trimeric autotransporter adhesin